MDELTKSPEKTVHVFRDGGALNAQFDGASVKPSGDWVATLPGLFPEWLGGRAFITAHGVRYPYVVGAMANGIASRALVEACAAQGILAFFGAAGLSVERIDGEVKKLKAALGDNTFGVNLIHAPHEPHVERDTADILIRENVTKISASAYMKLTAPLVKVSAAGLTRDGSGRVIRKRHIFAKISRPEVAEQFMRPAPTDLLNQLVSSGDLTPEEAALAQTVPVAEDITVESDSGGHTDNQPLGALFPRIATLRAEIDQTYRYDRVIRLGAAGGIGTPDAVASAFALGADYVLTGSINQATVESGLSDAGKQLLTTCDFGDVMMAPAADMFEMGVKVQVLKRGTMFGVRGTKLWDAYNRFQNWPMVSSSDKEFIETRIFGASFGDIWSECESFFVERDPRQLERAASDPRHKMALVFRWYLGNSSRWAIQGTSNRLLDFQIWCGPAMASFNAWAEGTYLQPQPARFVADIAHQMMKGAAVVTRAQQLKTLGLTITPHAFNYRPVSQSSLHPAQTTPQV